MPNACPTTGQIALTRRGLLRAAAGGLAAGLGALTYARFVEPRWVHVTQVAMDLPDLAPALAGLRLVQLSDLHLGAPAPADYLRAQLQRARQLRPDLIALTGDFIHAADLRCVPTLVDLLRELSAPLGVFAVLGNHDFGNFTPHRRSRSVALASRVGAALAEAGVRVLRNESCLVERDGAALQLVGVDDLWSGQCDAQQAFQSADPDVPTIVLAHNPDTLPHLSAWPWDWVLCGHTHGGQVRIPFYGAVVLPVDNPRFDAGLFRSGQRGVYVNRGLGSLHGVRFNCRPEITVFTLTGRK